MREHLTSVGRLLAALGLAASACLLVAANPAATAVAAPATGTSAPAPGTGKNLLFSPYKDVTINMNWNTNTMQTAAATGSPIPVVGAGSLYSSDLPNLSALTLAFATGECGSESWGGVAGSAWASANISALSQAGLPYVVSTGGQAGSFTCGSSSGMDTFLSRYYTPQMVGMDFDIESALSADQLNSLISAVQHGQSEHPNLRWSFTLATWAGSDGSYGGLNSTGDAVVKAIKAAGLSNYTIDLMAMDYGKTSPQACVVVGNQCEMGQSAIQAVTNLEHTYAIPAGNIELTTMIGMNDTSDEIFTSADVDTVVNYAVSNGLAGVHLWSLDRDTPCADTNATPTCDSVSSSTPLEYTKRALSDLGR